LFVADIQAAARSGREARLRDFAANLGREVAAGRPSTSSPVTPWLFAQRDIKAFYVVDVIGRPNGERVKSLTIVGMLETAELPRAWPSWRPCWGAAGRDLGAAWDTSYRTSS
jgi:hypothetical protein